VGAEITSNSDGPAGKMWPLGDSEIPKLIRDKDWSKTPLGPISGWTQSLRTTVDLMLVAGSQIVLFCGPQFVALYNQTYAPTIGDKHPHALGRPANEYWGELWDDLEPLLRGVLETGETFSSKDRPFYIERDGDVGETVYFDVSYSAVRTADGAVEAVLCLVSETTERVLTLERLRASEERFRALVNASSDVIYRMSPDWKEMRHLDGRGFPSDVEGPTIYWQDEYLFPEDRSAVQAAINRAVQSRSVFDLEHRVRRSDGSEGWTASRAVPIVASDGSIAEWFGMAADISQKRDSERRIRLLLREVNHRVKNQFAVILSMIRETSKRSNEPKEFEDRIRERIMALARSHDLLVSTDWRGATLLALVREQLNPFGRENQVFVSGPALWLQATAVQSIGMGLHELGTNAVKYGALSDDDGSVSVTWSITTDSDGKPIFELTWNELYGSANALNQTSSNGGFGSVALQRVVPQSMSGSASLSRFPGGLRWALSAPLSQVQATGSSVADADRVAVSGDGP